MVAKPLKTGSRQEWYLFANLLTRILQLEIEIQDQKIFVEGEAMSVTLKF